MFRSWCGDACVDVGNSGPSKVLGSKAMPSAQLIPLMLDISLMTASDGDNLHEPSCNYLQAVECFGVSPSAILCTHLDCPEQSLKRRCEVGVVRKDIADTRDGFRRGFCIPKVCTHRGLSPPCSNCSSPHPLLPSTRPSSQLVS
jgi:hypothetical protein